MTRMAFPNQPSLSAAKRFLGLIVAVVVLLFVGCGATARIDAGHVGIKVNLAGSDRGIQDMQVAVGWVFFNPLTQQIIIFPTSVQNIIWTASAHEGASAHDESISFSSSEGVNINADIALSFRVEPSLVPRLYGKFRQNDLNALAYGFVRNTVREAFNEVTSKMPVQEIYGTGKSQMIADVTKKCREKLSADGFIIEQLTINGTLRLPQNVADAINRAMEATQNAIQSENRVRQVKAEAEQSITKAHGDAEAARQRAQGEGDALLIRARAESHANEIIRLSTTPAILQYRALERWDGKLPTYSGGQLPLLTFDASKLGAGMDEATRERRLKELLAEEKASANAKQPPADPAKPPVDPAKPAQP